MCSGVCVAMCYKVSPPLSCSFCSSIFLRLRCLEVFVVCRMQCVLQYVLLCVLKYATESRRPCPIVFVIQVLHDCVVLLFSWFHRNPHHCVALRYSVSPPLSCNFCHYDYQSVSVNTIVENNFFWQWCCHFSELRCLAIIVILPNVVCAAVCVLQCVAKSATIVSVDS